MDGCEFIRIGLMRGRGDFTGLVVEDEFLLRLELADELSRAGWHILEAGNGEDALMQWDRVPKIDFLVTDIRLPGTLDGWALAEAMRRRNPALPVIYVSANPIQSGRQVSDSVFLGKPVDIGELQRTCDRLVLGA